MGIEMWMSRPVVAVGLDADLGRAVQRMWDHDCGAVVVVDGDGRLAGIVTDRDACMAAYTQGRPLASIPVTTAMARDVASCRPDESAADVMQRLAERQIRRLPVVDAERRPIGVISLADLARATSASSRGPGGQGASRQLSDCLAAITRARDAVVKTAAALATVAAGT